MTLQININIIRKFKILTATVTDGLLGAFPLACTHNTCNMLMTKGSEGLISDEKITLCTYIIH